MIFDLHNDFPTVKHNFDEYLSTECCGNIVTAAIWTTEFDTETAAVTIRNITDRLSCGIVSARCPIAIEDVGCLEYNDEYLSFDFTKYLYCSLTWNYDNGFAGGALSGGTLTEKGRRLVSLLNGCGCAVDLAHLNERSFFETMEIAERPICSHTGFNSHPRSLDDVQISALVARNALIGLCAVKAFTDARTKIEFADIIDRFVQKYGIDNLSFGTDFCGSVDLPPDLSDYGALATVASILSRRGYSPRDIDKIYYKNAERLLAMET